MLAGVFCSKWESLFHYCAGNNGDHNSCMYLRDWTETYCRTEVQTYFEGSWVIEIQLADTIYIQRWQKIELLSLFVQLLL